MSDRMMQQGGMSELSRDEPDAVVGGVSANVANFIEGGAALAGAGVLGWGAAGAAAVGIGAVGVAALGIGAVGLGAWGIYKWTQLH